MKKKCLLVTGASSDIGMSLIEKLNSKYEIIVGQYCHMNNKLSGLERSLGDRLLLLQADFESEKSVFEFINNIEEREFIPDHIIHLVASKTTNIQFRKIKWDDVEKHTVIGVKSIMLILKSMLPKMSKIQNAKVVFMLTAYVNNLPPKYQTSYVMAKYMLMGLLKSLTAEYAETGISFNAVSPEMIETKFISELPHLITEKNAKSMPLQKNLQIEDVIASFEFLLSDGANMMNGQNLILNGGKA